MQNTKLNKLRTVLSVLVLAFTLFSFAFTISESNHNCTDENCPICYVLQVAKSNLQALVLTFAAAGFVFVIYKFKNFIFKNIKSNLKITSLISLKVRLND